MASFSFHDSYFAPEYFMHGIVDEKTDVYAFGVLLLEIITGRPAVDESQKSIVLWVYFYMQISLYTTLYLLNSKKRIYMYTTLFQFIPGKAFA